jgi:hypothetical protein
MGLGQHIFSELIKNLVELLMAQTKAANCALTLKQLGFTLVNRAIGHQGKSHNTSGGFGAVAKVIAHLNTPEISGKWV